MLKEENEPSFLKIQSFVKSKLENIWIELWTTVFVIKINFYIFNLFPMKWKLMKW